MAKKQINAAEFTSNVEELLCALREASFMLHEEMSDWNLGEDDHMGDAMKGNVRALIGIAYIAIEEVKKQEYT